MDDQVKREGAKKGLKKKKAPLENGQ